MKHAYYPSLDGVRTIAVGIVLAAHGGVTYFRSGGVGVDIFFVLSGFLITNILSAEWARSGSISFRNFYARRFLRLAPALLLTCVVTALGMLWFEGRFPGKEIALAMTYTANWALALYNYNLTWLNHCWSLSIEEQFYLIWPMLIVLLERNVRSPLQKGGLLVMGGAALAIYRASRVGIYTDERINFGLDTRMDALMAGAALAYFFQCFPGRQLPVGASKILGRVVAPLMMIALFAVPNIVTWYSPWMGRIGYVLVAGAAALIVSDLVVGRHSVLAPLLAKRPMLFIGRISYGLYLFHLPIYYMIEKIMPEAPLITRLSLKVSLSIGVAATSFFWFEQRFLRLKTRFESKPKTSR